MPVRVKPKEKEPPKEKKPAVASSKSSLTNLVKRPTVDNKAIQLAQAKRDQEARDAARDARELKAQRDRILSDVDGAIGGATSRLSKSGVAISPGQDFGGAAAAAAGQYGDSLKAIYDAKWTLKSDAYDDDTAASVRVIVRRDGSVVSATMTKPSGNAGFDRSVRAVLNDVTRVLPFPTEMKDSEREFTWRFVRRTRAG